MSLLLLAARFAGYALSQLVEAVFRPRHAGSRFNRWRQRALSMLGCLLYSAFSISTISLLLAFRHPAGTARSEQLEDTEVTAALLRTNVGRFLLLLVGIVVVVAGVELGRRSVRLDQARQAKGLDATFRSVADSAYGPVGLGVLAIGLFCYGLYCLLEARYRDLTPGR